MYVFYAIFQNSIFIEAEIRYDLMSCINFEISM